MRTTRGSTGGRLVIAAGGVGNVDDAFLCESGGADGDTTKLDIVDTEEHVPQAVRAGLSSRGHVVHLAGDWHGGNAPAASINPDTGVLCAGTSPGCEPAYADAL